MTQISKSNRLSGKAYTLHVQRKRGKSGLASRACLWYIVTVRELFIGYLFLQAKQLTITTTEVCDVGGSEATENVEDGGTWTH
jgi:hypothetical protein